MSRVRPIEARFAWKSSAVAEPSTIPRREEHGQCGTRRDAGLIQQRAGPIEIGVIAEGSGIETVTELGHRADGLLGEPFIDPVMTSS